MRLRILLTLSLAFAISAPAVSFAQEGTMKPGKAKSSTRKKARSAKSFEAARRKRAAKMTGMGANAAQNMDPTLQGLLNGPDSMVNITKRAENMSERERDELAEKWRAKQARKLGIGNEGTTAPVMSLDELGGAGPRAKLVLASEEERRAMLLDELRTHARYSAKIDRVNELARSSGQEAEVKARAKALRKLEAKRHARTKIRIRAAKIDPAAAANTTPPAEADAAAPAQGGE